ncbi:SDR family oxidoreductase [Amorphus orientalis]|uniref:NAD(P)-dependent dehydrogenase (Short-subunit alcohol dehydrogenase family) n=1 Tax=Amorphus orientalis TaxID=649198 RepID=A0AAE4ARQ2_9HYPH|nr:SDR family oxidoreductase [Amorphus orientalis]MDQ0315371.1 NAD(P)-dependent dehydrogenase (short-subunit alcohol dehydrogenase family) [Amorphus orientalis]
MDLGLKGRTAVVTGGSSGIGLAAVRQLLEEGANVALCARGAERLAAVHGALEEEYGADRVMAEAVSVLDAEAFGAFAERVLARFGGVDILINNAGQGRVSTFASTSDDDWRQELELKFFSQINPVRAFQDALEASGIGAIVAVNSLLAYQPEPHMVCTSSARAGVQNLLKSLSVELAPAIRVNSILLGLVDSNQWQRRFEAREDRSQTREAWFADLATKKNIPLGRLGQAEEAARALVFLASPAASYITGAQLEISGGVSRFA